MQRLLGVLIASVATIALTQIASAADLPVKAPIVVAPVPTWTGFYAGVNVGYSWGNAQPNIIGIGSIGVVETSIVNANGFADTSHTQLNGIVGGGQVGYNYQFNPRWVMGLETDIQGSGERASKTFVDPISGTICGGFNDPATCGAPAPLTGTALTAYEARIDWFGTLRGRLGYLITDQLLLYGTGGLAYGGVKVSGTTNVSVASQGVLAFIPGTVAFGASGTKVGFAAGGGVEGRITANWNWKLEYLYIDLGSLGANAPFALVNTDPDFTPATGTINTHTHFRDNIVRVGVNYLFH
jgi:outer membrane immunogenic protein